MLNTHFHNKNISDIIYLDRSKTEKLCPHSFVWLVLTYNKIIIKTKLINLLISAYQMSLKEGLHFEKRIFHATSSIIKCQDDHTCWLHLLQLSNARMTIPAGFISFNYQMPG
jgi:hypothetical protein